MFIFSLSVSICVMYANQPDQYLAASPAQQFIDGLGMMFSAYFKQLVKSEVDQREHSSIKQMFMPIERRSCKNTICTAQFLFLGSINRM